MNHKSNWKAGSLLAVEFLAAIGVLTAYRSLKSEAPPRGETHGKSERGPSGTMFLAGVPLVVPGTVEAPAAEAPLRLRLMKDRCLAGFDGTYMLHPVAGSTKELAGEFSYEKDRLLETSKLGFAVMVGTLQTGDADRDREIREKVLESNRFPKARVEVASVRLTEPGTAEMAGTIEVHGVLKKVTIPCRIALQAEGRARVTGDVKVKLSDFGIHMPRKAADGVVDEFRLWFEVVAEPVTEPLK